jgi:3-deoxy-D-manno-octulosonic-acid transferase
LEPARLGCAIAVGPFTGNFSDHVALLKQAEGLVEVADESALGDFVSAMLDDPARRTRLGEQAAAAVRHHADLAERTAETLLSLLSAR